MAIEESDSKREFAEWAAKGWSPRHKADLQKVMAYPLEEFSMAMRIWAAKVFFETNKDIWPTT